MNLHLQGLKIPFRNRESEMTYVSFSALPVDGVRAGIKYLRQVSCCLYILLSCSVLMAEETTVDSGDNKLELSVVLEVRGLEPALLKTSAALVRLADTLDEVAKHPNLDSERQKDIVQTLQGVERLGLEFQEMMDQVPQTVERTGEPLLVAFQQFSGQVKSWVMLTGAVLLIVIVVALAVFYFSVIAPAGKAIIETSRQVKSLSENLKETSSLVVQVAKINQQVSQQLEGLEARPPESR
jgi:preprotein translocase subunit YajC